MNNNNFYKFIFFTIIVIFFHSCKTVEKTNNIVFDYEQFSKQQHAGTHTYAQTLKPRKHTNRLKAHTSTLRTD